MAVKKIVPTYWAIAAQKPEAVSSINRILFAVRLALTGPAVSAKVGLFPVAWTVPAIA
jgi:hypothetical protein